jgi:hypothetical protein
METAVRALGIGPDEISRLVYLHSAKRKATGLAILSVVITGASYSAIFGLVRWRAASSASPIAWYIAILSLAIVAGGGNSLWCYAGIRRMRIQHKIMDELAREVMET